MPHASRDRYATLAASPEAPAAGAQAGEQEKQDQNKRQTVHGCSLLAGTAMPAGSGLKGRKTAFAASLAGVNGPAWS